MCDVTVDMQDSGVKVGTILWRIVGKTFAIVQSEIDKIVALESVKNPVFCPIVQLGESAYQSTGVTRYEVFDTL